MRTRKSAHGLPLWDPILLWYAKAVRQMKTRPITDPTSWRYQAAIHEYNAARDPFRVPGEPLPSASDRSQFWNRCQHGSWFFLPWHRAYLLFFERTVAATIVSLGGPPSWALPYWDYSPSTDARKLPKAFQEPTLPDGTPNPLLVAAPNRAPAANSNLPVGSAGAADIARCLARNEFTNTAVVAEFGGGQTGFAHREGVAGVCEATPHGTMHDAVGGPVGWMGAFDTAALDPIFWLHHANIDRLWELWHRQNSAHRDPAQPLWRTGVSFDFHDEHGTPITITAGRMVDIADPFLDYDYEGLPSRPAPVPVTAGVVAAEGEDMARRIPEMVGATAASITLGGAPGSADVTLAAASGPALAESMEGAGREIHLVLENVQAPSYPIESYEVYVNLPENPRDEDYLDLRAGILPRFGVVEASQADSEHGGAGLNLSFEITPIVKALEARGQWDPERLRVSFIPVRTPGDREGDPQMVPVRVGRISVYFS